LRVAYPKRIERWKEEEVRGRGAGYGGDNRGDDAPLFRRHDNGQLIDKRYRVERGELLDDNKSDRGKPNQGQRRDGRHDVGGQEALPPGSAATGRLLDVAFTETFGQPARAALEALTPACLSEAIRFELHTHPASMSVHFPKTPIRSRDLFRGGDKRK
jgi:hypothetical protein